MYIELQQLEMFGNITPTPEKKLMYTYIKCKIECIRFLILNFGACDVLICLNFIFLSVNNLTLRSEFLVLS